MNKKIAIIGAGNMGQAIAHGLLRKRIVTKDQLFVTNSKSNNNKDAVKNSDIVILAVKPYVVSEVLEEIKGVISGDQLIISVVAGVTISSIEQLLNNVILGSSAQRDDSRINMLSDSGQVLRQAQAKNSEQSRIARMTSFKVIRVMSNLAAKVGESLSGWFANKQVTNEDKREMKEILTAIGKEIELEKENQLDMITAISGSGPAYFFYMIQLLEENAKALGLSEEVGKLLAEQTLIGTAEVMKSSKMSAKELRAAVTSKGGTTEAAFSKFEKGNLGKLFKEGVVAAYKRAKELRTVSGVG